MHNLLSEVVPKIWTGRHKCPEAPRSVAPSRAGARWGDSLKSGHWLGRRNRREVGGGGMGPVYERCCGLDVHKKTVVACVRTLGHAETRTFGTMTRDVLALADWLTACGVTHVAMESTGVYWKPIYNILEGNFTLLVVNAQHLKAVPGRKTDVKDDEWLSQLLQHGLVR